MNFRTRNVHSSALKGYYSKSYFASQLHFCQRQKNACHDGMDACIRGQCSQLRSVGREICQCNPRSASESRSLSTENILNPPPSTAGTQHDRNSLMDCLNRYINERGSLKAYVALTNDQGNHELKLSMESRGASEWSFTRSAI